MEAVRIFHTLLWSTAKNLKLFQPRITDHMPEAGVQRPG